MYSDRLIDHFKNPRNVGMLRNPDGLGEDEDGSCGDLTRFYIRVADGRVVDARFQSYGCGPTIAASSAGSELVVGRGVGELLSLTADDVTAAVGGLPPERQHAAHVVARAIQAAARDHLRRQAITLTRGAAHGV